MAEVATPLMARPYDLRHAAVLTWLNAGVPATQVAEWAGHSVDVLLRVYAKCIAGQQNERLGIRNEKIPPRALIPARIHDQNVPTTLGYAHPQGRTLAAVEADAIGPWGLITTQATMAHVETWPRICHSGPHQAAADRMQSHRRSDREAIPGSLYAQVKQRFR